MRHNGDLLHGLGVFLLVGDHRVADLVIGDELLFKLGEHAVLLLAARDDELERREHILLRDELAPLAHGAQRRFVGKVCKVCAHAARGRERDLLEVNVLGELDAARVDLKGREAAGKVRAVYRDAAVEAAGTQQRLVEHLRAVRRGEDDDALAGVKAVHLGEQLVERLLALVVAAAVAAAVAGFADGVDLVDEDDAGGDLRRFGEEVAHAARADAHEHFNKVGAGDGEERHLCLARHGLCKQRLTRTGRADEQRALGDLRADGGVLLGVVQKVDDLDERFLRLVLTGDVRERHACGLFHVDLGVGLADVADAADPAHAAGLFRQKVHQQHERADHQHRGQDIGHHKGEHRRDGRLIGLGVGHALFIAEREQAFRHRGNDGGEERVVLIVALAVIIGVDKAVHRRDGVHVVVDLDGLDLARLHQIDKLAVGNLAGAFRGSGLFEHDGDIVDADRQQQCPQDDRPHSSAAPAVLVAAVAVVSVVLIHDVPPVRGSKM